MPLPDAIWQRVNWAWVLFFAAMGVLNLWVAFHFETATWVNFKLFGATGLMLVFMVGQGVYLQRHMLPGDAGGHGGKGSTPPPLDGPR